MVVVGGQFLYRYTGLCSAIWLSIYLTAALVVDFFQPMLSKGLIDPLNQLWQSGQDFPGRQASAGETIQSFSYALALPLRVAPLLAGLLVVADMARLLERLGIKTDSIAGARLLAIHSHHSIWGGLHAVSYGVIAPCNGGTVVLYQPLGSRDCRFFSVVVLAIALKWTAKDGT